MYAHLFEGEGTRPCGLGFDVTMFGTTLAKSQNQQAVHFRFPQQFAREGGKHCCCILHHLLRCMLFDLFIARSVHFKPCLSLVDGEEVDEACCCTREFFSFFSRFSL